MSVPPEFAADADFRAARLGLDLEAAIASNPVARFLTENAEARIEEIGRDLILELDPAKVMDLRIEGRAMLFITAWVRQAIEAGEAAEARMRDQDGEPEQVETGEVDTESLEEPSGA